MAMHSWALNADQAARWASLIQTTMFGCRSPGLHRMSACKPHIGYKVYMHRHHLAGQGILDYHLNCSADELYQHLACQGKTQFGGRHLGRPAMQVTILLPMYLSQQRLT